MQKILLRRHQAILIPIFFNLLLRGSKHLKSAINRLLDGFRRLCFLGSLQVRQALF
jgi:hypothetical protein